MGGPPEAYSFRGFIPSSTHLQPWFFIGFAGVYNYLITKRGGPSSMVHSTYTTLVVG